MAGVKKEKKGRKKVEIELDLPPESPPIYLVGDAARVAYVQLRAAAIENPKVSSAQTEALCEAARLKVRMEKLTAQVDQLESYTIDGSHGTRVNPLLPELRATERLYLDTLGRCLLTPRATTAARQPMTESQRKARGSSSGENGLDPKTSELFQPRVYRGRKASG